MSATMIRNIPHTTASKRSLKIWPCASPIFPAAMAPVSIALWRWLASDKNPKRG